jgi:hypothetical protein
MRVNPEWVDAVRKKAKEWDVPASELVRKMIEMGMVGDMLEHREPTETFQQRMRRISREGYRQSDEP